LASPDRSELRGNSDHFSARREPERNSKWPNKGSKTSKKVIATEQYGVVVSPSQLEIIDAPALPRSNQSTATLFDKGRNETNGE
jgi:hypothetical protein